MASVPPLASPLFLRESEVRRGIELLFFGASELSRAADALLADHKLGRAHHRALYFIARHPDASVSELIETLGITKQSLGRVLTDLVDAGLIVNRPGSRDKRQRLLRLTSTGEALEGALFDAVRRRLSAAYSQAGQNAVSGFWAVLEGLIAEADRPRTRPSAS